MLEVNARLRLAAWLSLVLVARSAPAAEGPAPPQGDKAPGQFIRLARDKDHAPLALETSITRFAPADGRRRTPTVDLVAAIHIAEKSYYQRLNREFEAYDAVLYELVAPEESSVPQSSDPGSSHPISLLQNGMKDLLGLEFQLKGIDYTRTNMVHADMSPDQFAESMRKRGESVTTMFVRMLGYALTRQSESAHGRKRREPAAGFVRQEPHVGLETDLGRAVRQQRRRPDGPGRPHRLDAD